MEGVDAFHTEVIAYPAITIIARSDAGTAGPSRVVGADAIDRSGLASVVSALRHDSSAGNTGRVDLPKGDAPRSEEHTSELQSLMRTSYAVFCLKKKKTQKATKQ